MRFYVNKKNKKKGSFAPLTLFYPSPIWSLIYMYMEISLRKVHSHATRPEKVKYYHIYQTSSWNEINCLIGPMIVPFVGLIIRAVGNAI